MESCKYPYREKAAGLEAKASDVTVVKVRVGIFGDEAGSKKIQDAIAQKIKG